MTVMHGRDLEDSKQQNGERRDMGGQVARPLPMREVENQWCVNLGCLDVVMVAMYPLTWRATRGKIWVHVENVSSFMNKKLPSGKIFEYVSIKFLIQY